MGRKGLEGTRSKAAGKGWMKDGKGQAELGAQVLGEGPSCCWWEGGGSYVASTPPGTIETSSCCSCFSFLWFS